MVEPTWTATATGGSRDGKSYALKMLTRRPQPEDAVVVVEGGSAARFVLLLIVAVLPLLAWMLA